MSTPLATPAQLGAFLSETITDTDPTALLMLSIASGMVRDYLQQNVSAVAGDVAELDPIEGFTALLPELPVTAFTQLETFDGTSWSVVDPANYQVSKKTGVVKALPYTGYSWPCTSAAWRATYSHGYAVVPDAIVGAVLGAAARAWSSPVAVDLERIGGYQVKYAMESAGFSPIEILGLERYKIARVA